MTILGCHGIAEEATAGDGCVRLGYRVLTPYQLVHWEGGHVIN